MAEESGGAVIQDIVILGAGGLAREVAFLIDEINLREPTWNLLGYVLRESGHVGRRVGRHEVVCTEEDLRSERVAAAIGIGNPGTIAKVADLLASFGGLTFPNLVHPSIIWDRDRIALGKGNVICAGNVFTTDIRIGSFNYLNLSCTYGHDAVIGDACVINPGVNLSGDVRLGNGCLVGTGATILQGLTIGDGAVVGAGALVTRDIPAGVTAVGVPAKPR